MRPAHNGNRPAAGSESDRGWAANVSTESIQRLFMAGYITAVVMPPVGFIVGIVLAVRLNQPHSKRGIWIMGLSVVAALVWLVALATGIMNPNSNTTN